MSAQSDRRYSTGAGVTPLHKQASTNTPHYISLTTTATTLNSDVTANKFNEYRKRVSRTEVTSHALRKLSETVQRPITNMAPELFFF